MQHVLTACVRRRGRRRGAGRRCIGGDWPGRRGAHCRRRRRVQVQRRRQHIGFDQFAVVQDNDLAHDVLHFADIARPVEGENDVFGGIRKPGEALAFLAGISVQEMAGDFQHVVAAVAQRRQFYRDHMEPVIQILAKIAFLHLSKRIAVGGADKAHVDLFGR